MTQPRKDQTFTRLQDLGNRPGGPGAGKPANPGNPAPPPPGPGQPAGYRSPQRQDGLSAQYLQTLRSGYFDQLGYIQEKFIVEYPLEIAAQLENGGMTRSLLRAFYGEVCDVRYLLRGGRPFEALRPRILKLEAFASNAANRRTNRAPRMFEAFITENVHLASKDPHYFLDGFCQHFECITLFFKGRR